MYTVKVLANRIRSDSKAAILHMTISVVLAIAQFFATHFTYA